MNSYREEKIKQLFKAYIDLRRGSEMSRRQFEVSVLRIAYTYEKIHMRDLRAEDVLEAIELKDPEIRKNKTLMMTLMAIAKEKLKERPVEVKKPKASVEEYGALEKYSKEKKFEEFKKAMEILKKFDVE